MTHTDPLDRVWAAVERLRGRARGGYATYCDAGDEYDELLAAIAATTGFPVHAVAHAAGLPSATIRDLRRRARGAGY